VTEIVDTTSGKGFGNLETFRIVKDGRTYKSTDINFWGVTFASDDMFYATLATRGQTYLVRGSVAARQAAVLRENVECPSLSPDGTKIAFKKASGASTARRWRFTVLDLRTGVETALPETRSIDDQLAWLDDDHVMYGVPRGSSGRTDVWGQPPGRRDAADARAGRRLTGRRHALVSRVNSSRWLAGAPPLRAAAPELTTHDARRTASYAGRRRGRWP
jgi:hypothetical protein